jgi:hypothetical protein
MARLFPGLERVGDLARPRHFLDQGELDPFDVSDHGDAHTSSSHLEPARRYKMSR